MNEQLHVQATRTPIAPEATRPFEAAADHLAATHTPPPPSWQGQAGFSDPDFRVPRLGQALQASPQEMVAAACEGMEIQAHDMMTRHLELVESDASLQHAAEIMQRCNVGFLPICEEGRPVGVLTDRDITVRATAAGADPKQICVRDVMTKEIHTCFQEETLREVAAQMQGSQVRRILVVDRQGKLVGIISLGDLSISGEDDGLSAQTLNRVSESNESDRFR
jgi:CBS domain-containing protein